MALDIKPATDKPDAFPQVAYHESGSHVVVATAEEKKALGTGYSDKPTEKNERAIRKASGAAKSDPQPGMMSAPMETY